MLYNALVLPHLQYCLMAWGDFEGNRNIGLGDSLLKLQKRLVGIIDGRRNKYHSDPILADLGILKVGDLYRQQLRIHAWKFWNHKLPSGQALMLTRVSDTHRYSTRHAEAGISSQSRDNRSTTYRVTKEWDSLSRPQRDIGSLSSFKKRSRLGFVSEYRAFNCRIKDCFVCKSEELILSNCSADPLSGTEG